MDFRTDNLKAQLKIANKAIQELKDKGYEQELELVEKRREALLKYIKDNNIDLEA